MIFYSVTNFDDNQYYHTRASDAKVLARQLCDCWEVEIAVTRHLTTNPTKALVLAVLQGEGWCLDSEVICAYDWDREKEAVVQVYDVNRDKVPYDPSVHCLALPPQD